MALEDVVNKAVESSEARQAEFADQIQQLTQAVAELMVTVGGSKKKQSKYDSPSDPSDESDEDSDLSDRSSRSGVSKRSRKGKEGKKRDLVRDCRKMKYQFSQGTMHRAGFTRLKDILNCINSVGRIN